MGSLSFSGDFVVFWVTNAYHPPDEEATEGRYPGQTLRPSASGYLQASSVNVVAVNTTGINGTVYARKEVILSAGAYQTPQLLELSGMCHFYSSVEEPNVHLAYRYW